MSKIWTNYEILTAIQKKHPWIEDICYYISYPFSIVSRAVMREIKVMRYNKLFMIMIIKRLRKDLSEHGYVLKLSLKQ